MWIILLFVKFISNWPLYVCTYMCVYWELRSMRTLGDEAWCCDELVNWICIVLRVWESWQRDKYVHTQITWKQHMLRVVLIQTYKGAALSVKQFIKLVMSVCLIKILLQPFQCRQGLEINDILVWFRLEKLFSKRGTTMLCWNKGRGKNFGGTLVFSLIKGVSPD